MKGNILITICIYTTLFPHFARANSNLTQISNNRSRRSFGFGFSNPIFSRVFNPYDDRPLSAKFFGDQYVPAPNVDSPVDYSGHPESWNYNSRIDEDNNSEENQQEEEEAQIYEQPTFQNNRWNDPVISEKRPSYTPRPIIGRLLVDEDDSELHFEKVDGGDELVPVITKKVTINGKQAKKPFRTAEELREYYNKKTSSNNPKSENEVKPKTSQEYIFKLLPHYELRQPFRPSSLKTTTTRATRSTEEYWKGKDTPNLFVPGTDPLTLKVLERLKIEQLFEEEKRRPKKSKEELEWIDRRIQEIKRRHLEKMFGPDEFKWPADCVPKTTKPNTEHPKSIQNTTVKPETPIQTYSFRNLPHFDIRSKFRENSTEKFVIQNSKTEQNPIFILPNHEIRTVFNPKQKGIEAYTSSEHSVIKTPASKITSPDLSLIPPSNEIKNVFNWIPGKSIAAIPIPIVTQTDSVKKTLPPTRKPNLSFVLPNYDTETNFKSEPEKIELFTSRPNYIQDKESLISDRKPNLSFVLPNYESKVKFSERNKQYTTIPSKNGASENSYALPDPQVLKPFRVELNNFKTSNVTKLTPTVHRKVVDDYTSFLSLPSYTIYQPFKSFSADKTSFTGKLSSEPAISKFNQTSSRVSPSRNTQYLPHEITKYQFTKSRNANTPSKVDPHSQGSEGASQPSTEKSVVKTSSVQFELPQTEIIINFKSQTASSFPAYSLKPFTNIQTEAVPNPPVKKFQFLPIYTEDKLTTPFSEIRKHDSELSKLLSTHHSLAQPNSIYSTANTDIKDEVTSFEVPKFESEPFKTPSKPTMNSYQHVFILPEKESSIGTKEINQTLNELAINPNIPQTVLESLNQQKSNSAQVPRVKYITQSLIIKPTGDKLPNFSLRKPIETKISTTEKPLISTENTLTTQEVPSTHFLSNKGPTILVPSPAYGLEPTALKEHHVRRKPPTSIDQQVSEPNSESYTKRPVRRKRPTIPQKTYGAPQKLPRRKKITNVTHQRVRTDRKRLPAIELSDFRSLPHFENKDNSFRPRMVYKIVGTKEHMEVEGEEVKPPYSSSFSDEIRDTGKFSNIGEIPLEAHKIWDTDKKELNNSYGEATI